MITEKMIEAAARAIYEARDRQILGGRQEWDELIPEDRSAYWPVATAALEAAERAAVSEEPVKEEKPIGYISDAGLRRLAKRNTGMVYPWKTDAIKTPLYTRPLPSPPEAPKGEE